MGKFRPRSAISTHIAAASKVLRTRMDRLMPLLATAHPAFGTDYWNSRILVDSSGRKRAKQQGDS
jgi:uncharacterized protein YfaA (DUF2138 family)